MTIDINFKEYIKAPLRELSKVSTLRELFKGSCIFTVTFKVFDYLVRASLGFPRTNYGTDLFPEVVPGIRLNTHDPIKVATFAIPWSIAVSTVGFYLLNKDYINKASGYVYNSIKKYFESRKVSIYNPVKPLLTEKDLKGLELGQVDIANI